MALTQFPEPADLNVDFINRTGDSRSISVHPWSVENPHPGFGKDPNILNEYGHTKYPMFVGNVIVNNPEEEKAARGEPTTSGWNTETPKLREDGPTVHEFVAAGYKAKDYPPKGWAVKSSQQEIDLAIAEEETAEAKAAAGWGK